MLDAVAQACTGKHPLGPAHGVQRLLDGGSKPLPVGAPEERIEVILIPV
jgi:hypothetical protein